MPTSNPRPKLLAIDPGLRELGYACFEAGQLVDYGVKVGPRNLTPKELLVHLDNVLLRFLTEKRPYTLALVQNAFSPIQQSALVTLAAIRMRSLARKYDVDVAEYALRIIRRVVCDSADATRTDQAKVLVGRFPELRYYLSGTRRWRARYYQHLFNAVACGLTHLTLSHP